MVPEGGLEPPRPCGHCALNAARLPIPPLWHTDLGKVSFSTAGSSSVGQRSQHSSGEAITRNCRHNPRGWLSKNSPPDFREAAEGGMKRIRDAFCQHAQCAKRWHYNRTPKIEPLIVNDLRHRREAGLTRRKSWDMLIHNELDPVQKGQGTAREVGRSSSQSSSQSKIEQFSIRINEICAIVGRLRRGLREGSRHEPFLDRLELGARWPSWVAFLTAEVGLGLRIKVRRRRTEP